MAPPSRPAALAAELRCSARPSRVALAPSPGRAWASVTAGTLRPRARAASVTARDSGWLLAPATAAASPSVTPSGSAWPRSGLMAPLSGPAGSHSLRRGCPAVRVPVLSNATVRTRASVSSAAPPLISRPRRAPALRPLVIAAGTLRTSAQGQPISSRLRPLYSHGESGSPSSGGPNATSADTSTTPGVYTRLKRSMKRAVGARLSSACSIRCRMRARVVSFASRVTRTVRVPSVLTLPPNTSSPAARRTGTLSPVTALSSRPETPSSITPSAGTRVPGVTSTR